ETERHLRQPAQGRECQARRRRRSADRQVPPYIPGVLTMATVVSRVEPDGPRDRPLTIGAVCRRLQDEFPDISISKIRYLEDQGLLAPRRTQGGYRLFSEDDVDRLETILRLQRDEFLPLRVIRQELTSPRTRKRKRAGFGEQEEELDLNALCEAAGIDAALARELEEFGLLTPRIRAGDRVYTQTEADIAET